MHKDIGNSQELQQKITTAYAGRKLWLKKLSMTDRDDRIRGLCAELYEICLTEERWKLNVNHSLGSANAGTNELVTVVYNESCDCPVSRIFIHFRHNADISNYTVHCVRDTEFYMFYNRLSQESREMLKILILEKILKSLGNEGMPCEEYLRLASKVEIRRVENDFKWYQYVTLGIE